MWRLILLLAFVASTAYAGEEIELGLTWSIKGGKISKAVFEFEMSNVEFTMSSRREYSLDIGGSVELHNGAWKINTIRKSNDIEINFGAINDERRQRNLNNKQWLRGRMARRFPHKEIVAASNAAVATKSLDADIIRK